MSYTASFQNVIVRGSPRCPPPLPTLQTRICKVGLLNLLRGVLVCLMPSVTAGDCDKCVGVFAFRVSACVCVCVCARATVDTYRHTRPYKANALHEVREVRANRYKQARLSRVNDLHEVRADKYKQGRL